MKKGKSTFVIDYPEIVKEWDYENNGELIPSQFSSHANRTVWWKCPNGHHYNMMISSRTGKRQQNCPICSGKRVAKGINDLFTTNPELKERWDFEKNTKNPDKVIAGCNDYAYWVCEYGHSFKSRIYNMSNSLKGQNCPVCRNIVIVPGVNDLLTKCPSLAKEWDYGKNIVKITEVGTGTQKKAWWKCEKGHSWEAVISSRALNNHGCPYCSNQKLLIGFNDTATLYPEILQFWDYDKNEKRPNDFVGAPSSKKAWFKCDKGHSWKTGIADFCRGTRCPVCCNKIIEPGFNDLATTHPHLLKEWDYEKNTDISPQEVTYGSDKKVWWICKKGHSWKAVISSRSIGKGCPECLKETQTSLTEKAFTYYLSKYFDDIEENVHLPNFNRRELDIYIPSLKLAVEYDGHNWHRNIKNDIFKDNLCKERGITLVRIREDGCPTYETNAYLISCPRNHGNILLLKDSINELFTLINKLYNLNLKKIDSVEEDIANINESYYSYEKQNSLEIKCPKLLKEWDYEKNGKINPILVSFGSNSKVWWKCEKGHSWNAIISSRVRGNGCPYCKNKYFLKGFNDLESQYPELAKEWNIEKNNNIKPDEVIISSSKIKYWWKCEKGHEWQAAVSYRIRTHSRCPICVGQKPEKGTNDLETLCPDLAKEWDYEKNGDLKPSDILPGSEKRIWWICPKGHSYDTVPRIRTLFGTGCPVCDNKRILKGYNDLETLHPELAKEWDYEKNGELYPSQVGGGGGSHKKVWWKCQKGHEWCASLSSRIGLHTGCPQCAIDKRKK